MVKAKGNSPYDTVVQGQMRTKTNREQARLTSKINRRHNFTPPHREDGVVGEGKQHSVKPAPKWVKHTLDLSRDRCAKTQKKGKGRLKLGSARQHAKDQKNERLDLQSGELEVTDDLSQLMGIIKRHSDSIWFDRMIDYIESLLLFIYDLVRARSLMDFFVASIHLVKHFTHKNLFTQKHMSNVSKLLNVVSLQDSGRDFIDSLKKLLTNWDRVRKSPLLKKITQLMIYVTTFGFYSGPLDADSLNRVRHMEEHFSSNGLKYSCDFVYYILDLIQFVCDKSYGIIYSGMDPKTLFVSNMEYDVWLEKAQEHLAKSNFLSNPGAYNIDMHEYLHTLKELTKTGMEIYKFSCDLDKVLKNLIRKTTFELQKVEMGMLSRESAQAMRQVPFCVAIEGDSSIGKTKIAEAIHVYFAKLFEKPLTGCERYTKSATCKFWDGFTSDQWSLFMDDVAMWSSDLDLVDESIMDIVRIVNNMPYMPDMAALEDKGKTPFKGELVIITTNSPDLKCNQYFSYPFAAARRVPFHIRARPKKTDGSFMIKADHDSLEKAEIPDSWLFDILVPIPKKFGNAKSEGIHMKQAKLSLIHENITMKELLLFIKDKATEHRKHQTSVVDHSTSMRELTLCDNCKLPTNFCTCVQNQSGLVPIGMTLFSYMCNYCFIRLMDMFIFYNIFPKVVKYLSRVSQDQIKIRLRILQTKARDVMYEKYSLIKPHAITVTVLAIVGLVLSCYKLLFSVRKQGVNFSSWGTTYKDMNERESVWQKEDYVVDTFDTTPQCLSMKGLPEDKIKEVVAKAAAYLSFEYKDKRRFCRLFNVKGQKFLTPNHCIPTDKSIRCRIVRSHLYLHRGEVINFVLNQSQIIRYPECDLCLITIPGIANGKDMTNLFIKEKALNKGPIALMKRERNGDISHDYSNFSDISKLKNMPLGGIKYDVWKTPNLKTNDGDCGAIMYRIDDMGLRLLGIHESYESVMGICGKACAVVLTHEFISKLPLDSEVDIVAPQLGLADEDVQLMPISEGSCLRSIDEGCVKVYGRVRPINRPRSHVKRTLLCDSMLARGYELKYGPPVMSSLKPWMINIQKQVLADNYVDWDDLVLIKDNLLKQWLTISDEYKEEINILDFKTSVNGKPGVRYIDSIPRNTSAGFPFCRSKKNYYDEIPGDIGLHEIEFNDQIMNKVHWRLENYLKMKRTYPVYRASLKDEATSHKKIEMGKTRVFMGAPVDFTIAMRSLLLSFVRVVQKNKLIFESAPGTEAQCIEWDHLYRYLTELGDERMIFGDFSGFDVTMRSDFMRAAFDLIEDFHRECGASDDHCKMIRALSYDVIFPLVEFNGDLIELNGKNPSGQPLTVILNGIVNCMYMRYCYLKLNPNKELRTFRENVRLLTYGDDNGMGVNKGLDWFNHSSIQEVLSTIGVTYTMADKESSSQKYIHIDEADFLKRKWRFEPETNSMFCPLSEDSIIKSLMIGVKASRNITKEQHAASIITSAQLEYFWHGKEIFEEKSKMLSELVIEHNLQDYLPRPLEDWNTLIKEYEQRSTVFIKNQAGFETRDCHLCGNPKQDDLYSYCTSCRAIDQCMICDDIVDDIYRMMWPKLWFCEDCYFTFFYDELYNVSLINDLFRNASIYYLQQTGRSDLPLDWLCRAPIAESALRSVWDRCIHICGPTTTNGSGESRLGCLPSIYQDNN